MALVNAMIAGYAAHADDTPSSCGAIVLSASLTRKRVYTETI